MLLLWLSTNNDSSQIPTGEDNNVDVIFCLLKLVGDTQTAEDIFLSKSGEFPAETVD